MAEFRAISGDIAHRRETLRDSFSHMCISNTAASRTCSRTSALRARYLPWAAIVLFSMFSTIARAQVAIDAAGPSATGDLANGANTLTFSHTTTSTGTNVVLVVGISLNISGTNTAQVTSVTYNGVTLTKAVAEDDGTGTASRSEIWYLVAPATGANNVVVTVAPVNTGKPSEVGIVAGAITFTGADQSTPIRGSALNKDGGGTGSKYAYVNVSSSANDYVFENLALVSGTTAASSSTAQVSKWATASTGGHNDAYGFGSTRAGAASVPMSENLSASTNWADAAVSIQPAQADLSVSVAGSSTQYPSNVSYTVTVTNNGPDTANTVSLTDTLPSGLTLVSATASGGVGGSCTGANCSWTSIASGASGTATITAGPSAPGGYPMSSSVSATTADLNSANNSAAGVAYSEIDQCTVTTATSNTTIAGTINEYFPGATTAAAGSTTISLGTAAGTAHTLAANDLVLIIQMQDAAINTTNGSTYGDGISGSGSTNLNNAGVYEYATVVSYSAPTLTVKAAGPGGGLLYTYTSAAASSSQGARTFQVVWVPNYSNGTLSGALTAPAWNGSTGGIVALNIEGILTLGGQTISVDGLGFRGAPGLYQSGAASALNTDYRFTAPTAYNTGTLTQVAGADGSKGEGIAGTPEWIENATTITGGVVTAGSVASTGQTYAQGYPLGSMARGAPGNAGGGATDADPTANDQNAGGGGGANGGAGGQGGDSWNSNLSVGGLGGAAFPSGVSRVAMGGGGGAGSSNNNNSCTGCNFVSSSGAPGGGIVMINAAQITGNVTITANGISAFNGTPQDGGGGGGAGGSIVFLWGGVSAGTSTITLSANGGRGGDAWDSNNGGTQNGLNADRHGPGGGGGGGVILYSTTTNATATPTVTGGAAAITLNTANLFYGATAGSNGASTAGIAVASSAGPHNSSACTDLSITKSGSPNPVVVSHALTYTITVTNSVTGVNASNVFMTDNIPTDVTYNSYSLSCTPSTPFCSSGSCAQSGGVLECGWPTISAGQTSTVTVNTTAATPYTLATNTAIVNSTSVADSNPSNNTVTLNVPIEGPTAVRMNSFIATPSGRGTLLSWTSGGELRNLGFNVYREAGGQKVLLNPSLIAGSALLMREALEQHGAKSYGWIDPSPTSDAIYWLEDVDLDGTRTMHGPISVQNIVPALGAGGVPAKSFTQPQAAPRALAPRAMMIRDMATTLASLPVASAPRFRETVARPVFSPATTNMGFRLAGQPAVKILVGQEGWYQVTQPQLVAAGLPANLPARSLHLFAEGVEQAIEVTGPGTDFGPQSAIEFYGTPIDTPYSGQRVYWLAWNNGPGSRISNAAESGSAGPAEPSFTQTIELKPRTTYFAALLRDDTDNFFGPLVSSTSAVLNLDVQNSTAGQGTVEVSLQGVTNNQQHIVTVNLNGAALGELSFFGQALAQASFALPAGVLTNGTNTISLTSQMGSNDISLVDYVDVSFPHTFTAESDFLKFTAQSGQSVTIGGFVAPPTRLVDVTDPLHPLLLNFQTEQQGTYSLTATVPWTSSTQHTLLALSGESIAIVAGIVPHLPSALHVKQPGANVVMLTAPQFDAQLQPLAAWHRSQGNTVALLDVNQIYDEFNFGEPSPYAVKGFLQNSESAWSNKPRYLLLGGDASVDPRDYLGFGFFDFVPTKIIITSELKTASDDWFSDFNNSGFATIATGRLPARTTTDMQTMVSKTVGYAGSASVSWANNAMMVADVGDPSVSFSQESAAIEKLLPSSLNVTDLFVDALGAATVRQNILSGIQSGQALVDYNGHGSVEVWAGSDLFDNTAATALTNGNRLPVFVMMNCLNGFFHDVYTESLATALLLAPNGGAVAAWASSGLTAPDPQFQMNQKFVTTLFSGSPVALGDATLTAKQGIADPDARRTFILFGDPMLQIKQPAGGAGQFKAFVRPTK